MRFSLRVIRFLAMAGLALLGGCGSSGTAQDLPGAVYVLTNQSPANSVMVYRRDVNGVLSFSGSFLTGGSGAGKGDAPLGSQHALVLGPENRLLFAVNAGSNEVSMFAVKDTGLRLLDKQPSGGQRPISVAASESLVYVLNAGGTPNISGFVIDRAGGHLTPPSGSQQPLAGGTSANPAEVGFNPDATVLLVTEKGTQTIDTYTVDSQGYASEPIPHPSSGATPYGFSVINPGFAIVAESHAEAASSYQVDNDGNLTLVSGSVPLGQKAPCWLVTTGDGRYAYTGNAGSDTVGSFSIAPDGVLKLLNPTAAHLTGPPVDLAISTNRKFLYVRVGTGSVSGFQVHPDGSLTPVNSVTGIPDGAQGIAAR